MAIAQTTAAKRVSYQLDTLWDFNYEPTHQELESLYETAKKNQWNGSTAIDWSRPIGKEGPVLNVEAAFQGTHFYSRLNEEERREVEITVSAWRLSQFLHGEQGALLVASQPRRWWTRAVTWRSSSDTSRSCTRSIPWILSSRV